MIANTSLIDLDPASAVSYKLEKLSDQQFQVKLSTSSPSGNSEFKPPHAFRIPVQEPPPDSPGIPRCCPWYGMDIFWNHLIEECV